MPICHVPCVASVAPCVGRCVVTWGLQAWAPWGWEDTAGRVWRCHCVQHWFAPIREICKAEKRLGLVLPGITWEERGWDPGRRGDGSQRGRGAGIQEEKG